MMNPDAKTKWIELLRSGTLEQGRGQLRSSSDQFCCLGVLCEVAVKEGVIPPPIPPETDPGALFDDDWEYADETGILPEAVAVWAGLSPRHTSAEDSQSRLIAMNDTKGSSFAEIADYIEAAL